jgi:hypothetical protein
MRRPLAICGALALASGIVAAADAQPADPVRPLVDANQSDLASDGLQYLLGQVRQASFLLIGGLHGDNETQILVQGLLPGLGDGATLLVSEMSPWAASQLATAIPDGGAVRFRDVDIEEAQLARLIRELAAANPTNRRVQEMVTSTAEGYRRANAARLLDLVRDAGPLNSGSPGGITLATLVVRTLEVEADRAKPETAGLQASLRRERVLKEFFLAHYREAAQRPKVAAVFGRNHLHRGIDRRGVATLGNFLTEFGVAEGVNSFNVAIFAAGGQIALGGLRDFDERNDDLAFEYLAAAARHRATVFDMKPLREPLRRIPVATRTPEQVSLLYWADTYDAVICYREVTPTKLR